jgi:TPR repeat protein
MYRFVITLLIQGKYVKKDDTKANEYFAKAQQMNQGNLNNSRTSLMPS